eukprot:403376954
MQQQQIKYFDDFSYFMAHSTLPNLETNLSLQYLPDECFGPSNLLISYPTQKAHETDFQITNQQVPINNLTSEIFELNKPELFLLPILNTNDYNNSPLKSQQPCGQFCLDQFDVNYLCNNSSLGQGEEEEYEQSLVQCLQSQNQSTSELNQHEIHTFNQPDNDIKQVESDESSIDRFFDDFLAKNPLRKHSITQAPKADLTSEELRRRKNQKIRKSKEVYKTFESYYQKDSTWSRALIDKLALELDLTPQQVYKWNWDKKKRDRKKALKAKMLKTKLK